MQILSDLESKKEEHVFSKYLATFMRVDDTQVRRDVSFIGYRGKPKTGYSVHELKKAIEDFLGINYQSTAVLIGAGKLGSALAEYPGFKEYGVKLVAVFDTDPRRVGQVIGETTVLALESLPRVVKSFRAGIAILTVPKGAAQGLCDMVIGLGIKAIWNFAPTRIEVPGDVIVRNENLAVGAAMLSRYIKDRNQR